MNTCPVDRKKFYCIKLYLHLNGKCIGEVSIIKSCTYNCFDWLIASHGEVSVYIIIQVAVKEKDITDLFAEDDNIVCQICQLMDREDLLLLCDGCDLG